jgi:hypothetical protein
VTIDAYALAIHPTTGDVYVAGYTNSTTFLALLAGRRQAIGGGKDAFVARLTADLAATGGTGSGGLVDMTGSASSMALVEHPCVAVCPSLCIGKKDKKE